MREPASCGRHGGFVKVLLCKFTWNPKRSPDKVVNIKHSNETVSFCGVLQEKRYVSIYEQGTSLKGNSLIQLASQEDIGNPAVAMLMTPLQKVKR